jgi:hypothetical protein
LPKEAPSTPKGRKFRRAGLLRFTGSLELGMRPGNARCAGLFDCRRAARERPAQPTEMDRGFFYGKFDWFA